MTYVGPAAYHASHSARDVAGASRIAEPSVTTCLGDFDPVIHRAATYVERLRNLADRVQGPQPDKRPGELQGGAEVDHSLLHSLNRRRSLLVSILDELETALNRLESSI